MSEIETIFERIPSREILRVATNIQARLPNDRRLEQEKDGSGCDWLTAADIQIQKLLSDYFSESPLAGTYITKAEENIKGGARSGNEQWQLLIDPLDGTNAFRRGEKTWGVMVGICDQIGVLKYSWNLVSTGDVFKTEASASPAVNQPSLAEKAQRGKCIGIDVYDYSGVVPPRFGRVFERTFSFKYKLTSYPAAVWAGWRLFQGDLNKSNGLDALLWLPSNEGKKCYPDYDLIFLGALPQRGLKIRLGKIDGNNALLAIAPSEEDVNQLCEIGLNLITKKQKKQIIFFENALQITQPILPPNIE